MSEMTNDGVDKSLLELAEAVISTSKLWNDYDAVSTDAETKFRKAATPQAVADLCRENELLKEAANFFYSAVRCAYDYQNIRQPDVDLVRARITMEMRVSRAVMDVDFEKYREVLKEAEGE